MTEPPKPTDPAAPTGGGDVRALLKRAAKGDEAVVPTIRKLLVENPAAVELLGGELARGVQAAFVTSLSGKNVGVREAIHTKLAALRAELLGAAPTPAERLLVEHVVACWLQVQDAEFRTAAGRDQMTFKQAEFHQRRMDATHRRYLAALKALALVRKLALPVLQVNVARKQVNVANVG